MTMIIHFELDTPYRTLQKSTRWTAMLVLELV